MIPCYWHYGGRGAWCHTIVEFLTRGCEHRMGIGPAETAVVVVKADAVPSEEQLNEDLKQIDRGVLIVTANEEGTFNTAKITHPRIKIWLQTPAPHQEAHRYLPWGWTPGLQHLDLFRQYDWSFAGQVTHQRRTECVDVLRKMPKGRLVITDGFSQGLSREAYADLLQSTKVVPCPSGPLTVDSFRVWEALEAGCVPVLDSISPVYRYLTYWGLVLPGEFPLPIIESWSHFPGILTMMSDWEVVSAHVADWWARRKTMWQALLAIDLHL